MTNQKGQALAAAVVVMLICSLFGLVGVSLLTSKSGHSSVGGLQSAQAFWLAHAGLEWYLQQLNDDTDWTDETNQTKSFANGSFTITVSNVSSTSIDINSTGEVVSASEGQDITRYINITAKKQPQAMRFAVYWGRDAGSWLELRTSTTVNGDLWSRGTTDVKSGCSVAGTAYCPSNRDITGAGSYTEEKIDSPYLSMPQIDESYYNSLISTYNSYINTYGTNSNRNQSTDLTLAGDIIGCKNFTTNGNITIAGYGYIVADRNINLHSTNGASGTLTITPSGGNIYFLAARNVTVNSTKADTNVTISSGDGSLTYLYSRAQTNNNQLARVRKHAATTTDIDSAFIIGRRRIIVQNGAQVTNSTLYVSDLSNDNNYLQITNSGTLVSGSVISVSSRDPGLIINNGASATGLVYQWGANSGYTRLNNATITGSVVASQYTNDRIVNSTITYSTTSLPSVPPEGFDGHISVEPDSWEGL